MCSTNSVFIISDVRMSLHLFLAHQISKTLLHSQHRLTVPRLIIPPNTYLHTSPTTSSTLNCYGVDLLPPKLQSRLFKSVKQAQVPHYQAQVATSELKKFGLDSSGSSFPLPDITPHLPPILNSNVSDHFWQVASEQVQPYTDLLLDLLASDTPPTPTKWNLEPGWTRYNASDGTLD